MKPLQQSSVLCLCVLFSLIHFSCNDEKQKIVKPVEIEFRKDGELSLFRQDSLLAKFNIEIADDEYERQTGLMYRRQMNDDEAMLFIFPSEDYRSFYMKNTYIALDIIYIDQKGEIVSFQYDAQPLDEKALPSNIPAKYVLEIKAGLAEKYDIQVDDKIVYLETPE
ncbi:MAG: DUF192 domain-containing protein [Bacteroidia bacterium]|nr:DUF192 domain-containing protein [Bacteroidia bacterium]